MGKFTVNVTNNNNGRKVPKESNFIENVFWNWYYSLTEIFKGKNVYMKLGV